MQEPKPEPTEEAEDSSEHDAVDDMEIGENIDLSVKKEDDEQLGLF